MPIVTTSKRKSSKSKTRLLPVILLATVAVAALAVCFTRGAKSTGAENADADTGKAVKDSVPSAVETTGGSASGMQANSETDSISSDTAVPAATAPSADSMITNAPVKAVNVKFTKPVEGFNGGSAEQLICMMMSADDRSGLPPLPMSSEAVTLKDFLNAVTNDIIVYETDSEEIVAFKEKVAEVKNQLAEIVEQGGSITNALKEYENWINENVAIRREVRRKYNRLKEEASQEEADAYLAEANKELEAEGISTVNLGKERKRNRARRDAREAEALEIIRQRAEQDK